MAIDQHPATNLGFDLVEERARIAPQISVRGDEDAAPAARRWYQWNFFGRVHLKHLVNFCRQFASYLDAGVNLNRALESLRRQYDRTALGPVIGRLQLAVRRGEGLTDAMLREPAAFDQFFLSMMRVAEARGSVPETLRMLSAQYDARQRLLRQTKSALIYPAFVILLSISVTLLLTILVLPPLVDVMRDVIRVRRVDLPTPTLVLMGFSDFIVRIGWWLLPSALFGTIAAIMIAYRTERGRSVLDEVVFHLPVIGLLSLRIDTTRFSRTLATLLDAGVDIGSSLALTADTLLLVPMRRAVLRAREGIIEGESLSASIELSHRFPTDLVAIMNSGEETGRLPEMLVMVAEEYEEQVEFMVKDLGNLLQPVIIVFVGGIVLLIAIAFFMGYASVIATLGQK
jgi:type II secretory pathway component PulF